MEIVLVENLYEVKRNIAQFNEDLVENEELRKKFFSHFKQWYYIAELDMFAPSKYIGYKDMNGFKYNYKDPRMDGRKTEAVLKRWFLKKDIPELLEELSTRFSIYGKIKKGSQIHILKDEINRIHETTITGKKGEIKVLSTNQVAEIPAIRILPMSKRYHEFVGKSIEEVQRWFEERLPFHPYKFRKGINTRKGTLVLFQYDNKLIASAILREKVMFKEKDYYKGEYIFVPESIAIFNPITTGEIQSIWNSFKGLHQSAQVLNTQNYHKLYELLLNKNIQYVFDKELDEQDFQIEIERVKIEPKIVVKDEPMDKLNRYLTHSGIKKWKRDRIVSKKAILLAAYNCEYDYNHAFFKSSITGKNYVEAHHLIPLEFQDQFDKSLDVEANIVSLCPLCHKQVHHASFEEKEHILLKLYADRIDRLKRCNIDVSLSELLSFYS